MKRTFQTQREQAAYALGVQDAKPPGETLTMDEIKAMSTEEAAARLDEITAALNAPAAGDGDDS